MLAGKVAVVTGGAQGIGEAYARCLAELNATVVIADVDEDGARAASEHLVADGLKASSHALDITDPKSAAALAESVLRASDGKGAQILVNNAALYRGLQRVEFADIDIELWRRIIDVNLTGMAIVSKAFLPQMMKAHSGVIVNQSSAGAYTMAPGSVAYCVSKAAVIGLTKGMAQELGPHGIRVNSLAPGFTLTTATIERSDEERQKKVADVTALRRNGKAEDLCGALQFLVTDASSWMTGQTILVDGGRIFLG